ncbi:uncharacterized protein LOC133039519 [Cannabis sativa]|uniref:uncharacterized protein LOC133039519 n=1 Tax=Cannabis sativa TaxID=3483 RepID=UPI0029CA3127|nr:uncharacterized protein LOC133039519 [Cannabis sativa]
METQHFCRKNHIMLLKDNNKINNDEMECGMCAMSFSKTDFYYYICDLCEYYIHKSCEELPKQINHHFHPHHPLFVQTCLKRSCHSCGQWPEKYIMDVECTQMSSNSIITTYSNEGQHCIQHSSHPHLLLLVNPSYVDDMNVSCFACHKSSYDVIGVYYYGCIRCKYFLHKQCIDQLPQQIQFFHHPNNHTHLSLHMKWEYGKCNICGYSNNPALYFECPQCYNNFILCLECGFKRQRTINYEYHPHILCLLDKIHTTHDRCNVYDNCLKQSLKSNSKEFSKTNSSIFGCLDCDFKLHLLCGPLPSIIKHESHDMHCLNLVDSCIEDTFGDYYCDICEEERSTTSSLLLWPL